MVDLLSLTVMRFHSVSLVHRRTFLYNDDQNISKLFLALLSVAYGRTCTPQSAGPEKLKVNNQRI